MLLRDALWMQNVPEVLLREEELIPSLISGILCTWLLSGTPRGGVSGETGVCSLEGETRAVGKAGPAETQGSTVLCSPCGHSPGGRPGRGGGGGDGGVTAPSSSHLGSL